MSKRRWEEDNRRLRQFETALCPCGYKLIAGIDEAGRGPLAGPVVAAAVMVKEKVFPGEIRIFDSKKLSLLQRQRAYREIAEKADVGIGMADTETIDRENILQATIIAMKRAVNNLPVRPEYLLIDGRFKPGSFDHPCRMVVRGDSLCFSIACASIAAKVFRDDLMFDYAARYPGYGFEKNRGYGTAAHLSAIKKYGITPIHRRSFRLFCDTRIQERHP